jgi:hypothetical protein
MAKITLGTYTLRVREKFQREDVVYETHGFVGASYDSLEFFRDALRNMYEPYRHLPRIESQLYIDDVRTDNRTIYGWVMAGKYGFSSDLRDVNTESFSYHRTPDDVELIPHFFLIDVPRDSERAVVILQRHGRRGIKTHFGHAIERAFSDWTENSYMLEFTRHVPNRVIQELTGGRFRKVDLITYDVPRDRNEFERLILDERERGETRGEVVFSLRARKGQRFAFKEWMRDILQHRRGFSEIREALNLEQGDRIQLTVDYGSGERTIDLSDPRDIRPYVEVPEDEVPLDEEGHPVRSAIVDFAMRLRDDLAEEIRGERR